MNKNDSNYNYEHSLFRQGVNELIKSSDRTLFTNIMLEKNYSFLSTKEKEDYILQTTLSLSKFYISANTFLEYLILEYNISEECYTKIAHPNGNKAVDDMFNTRRLNQELNKELPINSGTTTRIKV